MNKITLLILIIILPLIMLGQSAGGDAPQKRASSSIAGVRQEKSKINNSKWFAVTRVVDGDTFWIDDGTEKGLKVRLIGVDAPEPRNTGTKPKGYFGTESTVYLRELLNGKRVRLEYDVSRHDRYGRTLAYVWLEDGTFVNAELVRNGYATVMTVPPNVKYAERFTELASRARRQNKGLWKGNPSGK